VRALQVYSVAQRLCLPILFHQGTSPEPLAPLRYAHPLIMDEIAMKFPELRIVMAHLGHPWQTDTFMVIRKHPHVFADISSQFFRPWSQYNALRLATEWNVLDKLLFGTDYPVATPQETMEGLLSVNQVVEGTSLPRVPEDPLQEIIHRDSLTLLGIHVGD
jgi:predicted TIM-barrel fold metal-dependent hydrolase